MNLDPRMVYLMLLELEKMRVATFRDQYLQLLVVTLVGYRLIVTILIELFCMQLDLTVPGTFFLEYFLCSVFSKIYLAFFSIFIPLIKCLAFMISSNGDLYI